MEGEDAKNWGLWIVEVIRSVAVWSGQGKDNVTDCQ